MKTTKLISTLLSLGLLSTAGTASAWTYNCGSATDTGFTRICDEYQGARDLHDNNGDGRADIRDTTDKYNDPVQNPSASSYGTNVDVIGGQEYEVYWMEVGFIEDQNNAADDILEVRVLVESEFAAHRDVQWGDLFVSTDGLSTYTPTGSEAYHVSNDNYDLGWYDDVDQHGKVDWEFAFDTDKTDLRSIRNEEDLILSKEACCDSGRSYQEVLVRIDDTQNTADNEWTNWSQRDEYQGYKYFYFKDANNDGIDDNNGVHKNDPAYLWEWRNGKLVVYTDTTHFGDNLEAEYASINVNDAGPGFAVSDQDDGKLLTYRMLASDLGLNRENPMNLGFRWAVTCGNDIMEAEWEREPRKEVPVPAVISLLVFGLMASRYRKTSAKVVES